MDRLVIKQGIEKRLTDSIETVMKLSGGLMLVDIVDGKEMRFSESFACPDCNISIEELEPRSFSFNNPQGACPACTGLGEHLEVDPELVVPNPSLSLRQGAIAVVGWGSIGNPSSYAYALMSALIKKYNFDLDTPFEELPEKVQHVILYGTGKEKIKFVFSGEYGTKEYEYAFEGVLTNTKKRYNETSSESAKQEYESLMTSIPCSVCKGARLKPESLAVTIADKNIDDLTHLAVGELKIFFDTLQLTERQNKIGELIFKEIKARLGFLVDVGLDYLNLARASGTLSGGEAQRIRLATQIGSGLVGVLYILDEPSIGLHQRDNDKLIQTLIKLRDLGNTLIVVEHDEDTMYAADWIVDIGPGAGEHGGEIIASGPIDTILACEKSETGAYLSGRKCIEIPEVRRKGNGHSLTLTGAAANNLKM